MAVYFIEARSTPVRAKICGFRQAWHQRARPVFVEVRI
jgi:hypothetical protein